MADGTPDLSDHLPRDCGQARDKVHVQVLALTAQIVCAHLAHNRVGPPELSELIHDVYSSLVQVAAPSSSAISLARFRGLVPAVPPERSVFPEYIICLENGRRFRTLRRHLMAAFGLTPEQYRRRWDLPYNYPMIAPGYARARSGLAKATGLGRTSRPSARTRAAANAAPG